VVLFAVLVPVLQRHRAKQLVVQDRVQLSQLQASWSVFVLGEIDGTGLEQDLNTTANLFSAMIAQDYFNPGLLISPFDRNPVVAEDKDYDYSAYAPTKGVYWDPAFVADLEAGSNVSYAHLPLVGDADAVLWRSSGGAQVAVVGNRGPADGMATADSYSCRKDGTWRGNFVFNDNHLELVSTSAAKMITLDGTDNPFNFDPSLLGLDQVVAFTREVRDNKAFLQHD
jgi:hypothetical protein